MNQALKDKKNDPIRGGWMNKISPEQMDTAKRMLVSLDGVEESDPTGILTDTQKRQAFLKECPPGSLEAVDITSMGTIRQSLMEIIGQEPKRPELEARLEQWMKKVEQRLNIHMIFG